MKMRGYILRGGLFLAVAVVGTFVVVVSSSTPAIAQSARNAAVSFDNDGAMIRPEGYREWVYVGTPVTPNDMNNGSAPFPEFHNVYIQPDAFAAYKRTGKFPDGTTLVKELVSVGSKQATSGRGYFMGEFIGLEVTMKDAKRFKDEPGNWAYFSFGHKYPLADTAKAFPSQSCNACHANSAADDFVFTQYYPVLRAAKGGAVRPADAGHTLHDGTTCEECKAGIRRFAMAAGTARKPSADTPSGSLGAVPTGNEDLHKYLVAGKYKNFAAAQSKTHPSAGPHTRFGSPVKVYMNAMMSDAFKTGKKTLPKGAASVKEMFSKEGQLEGWAVMLKTKDDSDGGDGWFWYESTNISDASDVVARGNGVAMCYGCHSSGSDFVLTGYPLK